MLRSSHSSKLFFLLALAALSAPMARAATSPAPGASVTPSPASVLEVESRLDRITRALQERDGGADTLSDSGETLLSAAFVNGRYRSGYRAPRGGAFVNGRGYYGGRRSFVNSGGGYRGGFINGPVRPRFVNW